MRLHSLFLAALGLVVACGGGSDPVTPPPVVASVTVTGAPVAPIAPGATATLTAIVRDADGAALSGRTVTWTTSAAAVATVASNGTVTAVAPGTATITAASEGKSGHAQITVAAPVQVPTSITIQRSGSWLLAGDTLHLGVQVRDAGGKLIDGLTPTVTVAEGTGATLSGSVLTATNAGTVVVRATVGTLSSTATIVIFPGSGDRHGDIARLDSVVISRMREARIPGGALTIVKDGRLVLERTYGYADTLAKRIPGKDDLWRIGSLSKPLTAIGIMKLVQDGKLTLTEAAAPHLNAVPLLPGKVEDPRFASITIRQLLEHSGGWNANREVDDTLWAHAFTGTIDPVQLSRIARGVQLANYPGTTYGYTNYAYLLLARVIEQATGQPYETWMKANVMAPAGVTRMALGRTPLAQRLPVRSSHTIARHR